MKKIFNILTILVAAVLLISISYIMIKSDGIIQVEIRDVIYKFREGTVIGIILFMICTVEAMAYIARKILGVRNLINNWTSKKNLKREVELAESVLKSYDEENYGQGIKDLEALGSLSERRDFKNIIALFQGHLLSKSRELNKAEVYYKIAIDSNILHLSALKGLINVHRENKDVYKARDTLAKAFHQYKHVKCVRELFLDDCFAKESWDQALEALKAIKKYDGINQRSRNVDLTIQLKKALTLQDLADRTKNIHKLALKNLDFIPAVSEAISLLILDNNFPKAIELGAASWKCFPHVEVAKQLTKIGIYTPGTTSANQLFSPLTKALPDHPETIMLELEMAILSNMWNDAFTLLKRTQELTHNFRNVFLNALVLGEKLGSNFQAYDKIWSGLETGLWICTDCKNMLPNWNCMCPLCEHAATLEPVNMSTPIPEETAKRIQYRKQDVDKNFALLNTANFVRIRNDVNPKECGYSRSPNESTKSIEMLDTLEQNSLSNKKDNNLENDPEKIRKFAGY